MERYDYESAMRTDILNAIREMREVNDLPACGDLIDFTEMVEDRLWCSDSVTGNGSGSYFVSRWKAAEAVCHNLDLYEECVEELGITKPSLEPEIMDVSIRCYLLHRILQNMANVGDFDVFLEKTEEEIEDTEDD